MQLEKSRKDSKYLLPINSSRRKNKEANSCVHFGVLNATVCFADSNKAERSQRTKENPTQNYYCITVFLMKMGK